MDSEALRKAPFLGVRRDKEVALWLLSSEGLDTVMGEEMDKLEGGAIF